MDNETARFDDKTKALACTVSAIMARTNVEPIR
jgi:hypothetical protein